MAQDFITDSPQDSPTPSPNNDSAEARQEPGSAMTQGITEPLGLPAEGQSEASAIPEEETFCPPTVNSSAWDRMIEQRREMVASLHAQHATVREIEHLLAKKGVVNPSTGKPWSRPTIQCDIQAAREQWRQNTLKSMDDHIREQLAEINEALRRCWAQGDLTNLNRFLERQARLLGIDKPTRVEQNTTIEGTIVIPGIDRLDADALKVLQQIVEIFKEAE